METIREQKAKHPTLFTILKWILRIIVLVAFIHLSVVMLYIIYNFKNDGIVKEFWKEIIMFLSLPALLPLFRKQQII
jgi:hypothetical protein